MSKEDKLFYDLVEYFFYLDNDKIQCNWNSGYFRKLKKLFKAFCKEYLNNHWGWD